MEKNQVQYMNDNDFSLEKYLFLNPFLTKMALRQPGAGVSVIEIDDPESVSLIGSGCSVVFKKWADQRGITEAYEAHLEDSGETFQEKVDTVKSVLNPVDPKDAFDVPEPPKDSFDIPTPPTNNEAQEDVKDLRYDTLAKRKALLHSKGWMYYTEHKGYVNSELNRYIDENIVITIDDSRAFLNALERCEATPWSMPNVKKPEESIPEKAPSIIPTEEAPSILPTQDALPKEITLADEDKIKEERKAFLIDNHYNQDLTTYVYRKEDHVVSSGSISSFLDLDLSSWAKKNKVILIEVSDVKKEITDSEKEVVSVENVDGVSKSKIYTEKELTEMKTKELERILLEDMKIAIPEEGRNTNKKLRTLILGNQLELESESKEEEIIEEEIIEDSKPLENIISANEEASRQIKLMDDIISVCSVFKNQSYVLATIQSLLDDESMSLENKVFNIRNVIK